jgi:hypothetical protein
LGLFLMVFSALPLSAQETPDQQYRKLYEQSKAMPADFDFNAVRALYLKTSYFKPYGTSPKMDVHNIFKKIEAGEANAVAEMEQYKFEKFVLPEMHSRYYSYALKADHQAEARYHEWALRGFLTSLYKSGDGKGAATAFKVLNVDEEYLVARRFIDKQPRQSLKNENGRVFDVLEGVSKDTGEKIYLWFDITDIFSKMDFD